jgi:hypothetical protein
MFEGRFDNGDRVIVKTIYNKIIAAGNNQLKKQAKMLPPRCLATAFSENFCGDNGGLR